MHKEFESYGANGSLSSVTFRYHDGKKATINWTDVDARVSLGGLSNWDVRDKVLTYWRSDE